VAEDVERATPEIDLHISEFRMSDGTDIQVPPHGVTLFVGPNNSGKSQSLRDLLHGLAEPAYVKRAIKDISVSKLGSPDDFQAWFEENVPSATSNGIQQQDVRHAWAGALGAYYLILMFLADANSRLTAGNSAPNIDFHNQPAMHPIQRAYRNPVIEELLDKASRAAFGLGVTVDRYSGLLISLRIGEPPTFEHTNGVPSQKYLDLLDAMPKLEEVGDGVRSYLGLLLHLFGGSEKVLLIDEPEAFLHPPQAQRLGTLLAKQGASDHQVFLATHSADIVRGVLKADSNVTIIRVTRDQSVNHGAVLAAKDVKNLWDDPLLRYSNILDGLFHDAVILCESDADCRYYSSVLDAVEAAEEKEAMARADPAPRVPQLLFTHCGGKARMGMVVDALRAVGVPTVVVADFDVLRDPSDIERIFSALGRTFDEVKTDLGLIDAALKSGEKPVSKVGLQAAILGVLDSESDPLDRKALERVRRPIRSDSGWDKAKRAGKSEVPQGNPSAACARVLKALEDGGLLVVPIGELERFVPEVGGHGPAWVAEVHRQGLHSNLDNAAAVGFVKAIRTAAMRGIWPSPTSWA
jgi:energy-coupling factor transporter ATP-binding protein EcfA2